MKQEILKLVNQIKENLKSIDKEGVSHPLIDDVYEKLELIEDEIYEDDAQANALSFEDDDYQIKRNYVPKNNPNNRMQLRPICTII